jgi:hypothetical protein
MTDYTWAVNAMYTLQQPDPDYVVNVLWTLTGVDGPNTASIDGNTQFDSNQSGTFIPYDQLTEAIVIGWVQTSLGGTGIANFEANIQAQIASQINPPVAPQNTPLPWVAPSA